MRKLKTPEEIILAASTEEGFDTQEDAFKALIIAAQRDALECAAENATVKMTFDGDGEISSVEVDIYSILNLLPKDK